jgi:hypothetical protein
MGMIIADGKARTEFSFGPHSSNSLVGLGISGMAFILANKFALFDVPIIGSMGPCRHWAACRH